MSARLIVALGACLFALAGLPAAPASAVSTDQSYWVPANRSLVLHGHGFGHGHGMSQYGAQGAAKAGLSYRQIMDFYYPGTSWSTVTGTVRVLITSDTTSDVVVDRVSGLTLRDLGTGTTYQLPAVSGASRWRLTVGTRNRTVVEYLTDTWHRWSPGGRAALVGDGQFAAPGNLTLRTPSGARTYRGALRAASPSQGSAVRDTVNVLPMDAYVKGVIAAEMPALWEPDAVKAQAVAARTYATWSRSQYPDRYYQICDTSSCQVYGGVAAEHPSSTAAVTATARTILTFGGKPAFTQFSASNGGWTSAGSVPYLPAKPDPYDGVSGNPVHDWTETLTADRIERTYPSLGTLRRIRVTQRDGNGEWKGRVGTVVLDGTNADVTVSGDSFKSQFGLRSTWFAGEPTATLGGVAQPFTSASAAPPGEPVQVRTR